MHHLSELFKMLQKENFNVIEKFSKEKFKFVRERLITMILATDMSNHFSDLAKLKGRMSLAGNFFNKLLYFFIKNINFL